MNNPPKSSPESPAKEQPGEVAAMVNRLRAVSANSLLCQEAAALLEKLGHLVEQNEGDDGVRR